MDTDEKPFNGKDPLPEEVQAQPHEIPPGTYWPVVLAFGLMFLFLGLLTSWIVSVIGAVCMMVAFAGWIEDSSHG
jgi:hypothetical protein